MGLANRDATAGASASFAKTQPVMSANDISSLSADEPTGSIAPGGTVTGVVNTHGDVDYFNINLVAGQTYTFSLTGSGSTPLPDAFLSLARGSSILVRDDDGGVGQDALITFTASATGTYQIIAEGYPGAGLTGAYTLDVRQMGADSVGGTIGTATAIAANSNTFGFVETSGDIDTYAVNLVAGQYYTFEVAGGFDYGTSPTSVPRGELDTRISIYDSAGNRVASNNDISYPEDLSSGLGFTATTTGTYYVQVDAYARQTGGYALEVDQVDLSSLNPLDAIDWGTQLSSNAVSVYFARAGETFDGVTSLGWTAYEIEQAMEALGTYAEVSNLTFAMTTDAAAATFRLVTTQTSEFLGYFNPPGEANAGVGVFAINGDGWNSSGGLEQGGFGFTTLVHEFGHGLGLAHPHDDGGGSEIMPGVTDPFESYGVFDLNQGVYTTMSYNDGWNLHPVGPGGSLNYGLQGGPGAFDVALIQAKYGPVGSNSGDTVYTLPTTNAAGTFFDVIWDTGGSDTIAHAGTVSARIDLTEATLDYSATGGGVISYVNGVYGGFTIAAGVVIENAAGGGGSDTLIGNNTANLLSGGAGADTMQGRGGNDTLEGGPGADSLSGGAGADTFKFKAGDGQDTVTDLTTGDLVEVTGYSSAQSLTQSGTDVVAVLSSTDRITFQNTTVSAVEAAVRFSASASSGSSAINGTEGPDTLTGTGGNDTLHGLGGNDSISGLAGSDFITGGYGDDLLDGGSEHDHLDGGAGNDTFVVDNALDTVIEQTGGGTDRVLSSVDYSLHLELENLTLTGTAGRGTGNYRNNEILGNASNNVIDGREGDDVIVGGAGSDSLTGDLGSDRLYSDNLSPNVLTPRSVDTLAQSDTLSGGAGNDHLFAGFGDTVDGGADSDALYINFQGATSGVQADFRDLIRNGSLTVGGATLSNIEAVGSIVGSEFNDFLAVGVSTIHGAVYGQGGNDHIIAAYSTANIYGGDGDDLIDARSNRATAQHYGDAGNDTMIGGLTDDVFHGGDGNDQLDGGEFGDYLSGGAGDDTLVGGDSNDTLIGGAGADTFKFKAGDDLDTITDLGAGDVVQVSGYAAAQSVTQSGANVIVVLSATDQITFQNTTVAAVQAALRFPDGAINGTAGNDTLFGTAGADTINGFAGNDSLDGKADADTLVGGTGNDTYIVDSTDTIVEASGEGDDMIRVRSSYTLAEGVSIETVTTQNAAQLTAINLTGNSFANHLIGTAGANVLTGGAGNDRLRSLEGDDTLVGGAGADLLTSGTGNDTLVFASGDGMDTVVDLAAGDIVQVSGYAAAQSVTQSGTSVIAVLSSTDRITFQNTTVAAVQAALRFPVSEINGTTGNDTLLGTAGTDTINAFAGNDSLDGKAGADTLVGGVGNDTYYVDSADTIVEASGEGDDVIRVRSSYTLAEGVSVETVTTHNAAQLTAIDLTGNSFANYLLGTAGTNVLSGGGGNDRLNGLEGNDTLIGGAGADRITSGSGSDRIVLNDASDSTVGAPDLILDFDTGDLIDLSAIDANGGAAGDQQFQLIGNEAFHGVAGELRYATVNGNTIVYGDTNGDSSADFAIQLTGTHVLTVDHFAL